MAIPLEVSRQASGRVTYPTIDPGVLSLRIRVGAGVGNDDDIPKRVR
jgi:hypothetical protein